MNSRRDLNAALGKGMAMLTACCVLLGCPSSPQEPTSPTEAPANATGAAAAASPQQSSTAATPKTSAPVVEGTWTVLVTSSSPSINPAMFDSPEKKAKVFFDHEARAVGGRVKVTQRTLGKESPIKDSKVAADLDQLVRSLDWPAMKQRTASEEPSEGGTEFRFEVRLGDDEVKLRTTSLESYPELVKIVDGLKSAAGVP
jgi:hypothetical protein